MKIHQKIVVIVIGLSLIIILMGLYISSSFFMSYVKSQEQIQIESDIKNVYSFINKKLEKQDSLVIDWGRWDDTYNFVETLNEDYIISNLNQPTIDNLGISFMLFYNANSELIYKLNYDISNKKFTEFPPDLLNSIESFKKHFGKKDEQHKLMECNGNFYIISSTTVTDSLETEPSNGIFVVAREIDTGLLSELNEIAGGKIAITALKNVDKDIRQRITNGDSFVNVSDKDDMSVYTNLSVFGNPDDAIIFTKSRDSYNLALIQIKLWWIIYAVLIVSIIIVLLWALNFFVSTPIAKMANLLYGIDLEREKFDRIPVSGTNELSLLGMATNTMLDKIEKGHIIVKRSKERYRALVTQMKQGLAVFEIIFNDDGVAVDYLFLFVNSSFEDLTGLKSSDILCRTVLEVLPITGSYWVKKHVEVVKSNKAIQYEKHSKELGKYLEVLAYKTQETQLAIIITDITQRKEIEITIKESKNKYFELSYHDHLTGLYNRRFIENKLKNFNNESYFPISVIIGDVNGLKLVNDAFGFVEGDKYLIKAAEAFKNACGPNGICARWDGDEFILILPKTNAEETEEIVEKIYANNHAADNAPVPMSISLGWATKQTFDANILQVIKNAENEMYRHKVIESASMRGQTINTIITTLHEKNPREELHSKRVSKICREIGLAMELSEYEMSKLDALGLLHDIGKIGICETILNKPDSLDPDELIEMRRHCEIGYRILGSTNEMSELAEAVLSHHERWDGAGYPQGLKGEKIPLLSRILTVADSYDAMTSDRPYRKAMSMDAVIEQLIQNKDTQFDGKIVDIFINTVLQRQF